MSTDSELTDAKPPEMKNFLRGPPASSWTETTPGLSVEIVGTWLGMMPNSPSEPGTITISTGVDTYSDLAGSQKSH